VKLIAYKIREKHALRNILLLREILGYSAIGRTRFSKTNTRDPELLTTLDQSNQTFSWTPQSCETTPLKLVSMQILYYNLDKSYFGRPPY
jgi:hypothetical protein